MLVVAITRGSVICSLAHTGPIQPLVSFLYGSCDISSSLSETATVPTLQLNVPDVWCQKRRLQCELLGQCRLVGVERVTDHVVEERQTSREVFRCPVAEVHVQQALVTTCTSHTYPYVQNSCQHFCRHLLPVRQLFNGLFSMTTWLSQHQEG